MIFFTYCKPKTVLVWTDLVLTCVGRQRVPRITSVCFVPTVVGPVAGGGAVASSSWHHVLHPEGLLWVVEAEKGGLTEAQHAPCHIDIGSQQRLHTAYELGILCILEQSIPGTVHVVYLLEPEVHCG